MQLLVTVFLFCLIDVTFSLEVTVPCTELKAAYRREPSCCGGYGEYKDVEADTSCDASEVILADYAQWSHEDGYWLGEYSYYDGNGDPLYDPDSWNYPYDHYKGFVAGSVNSGSYSQRNVFLYPPQTSERCALDN